MNELEAVRRAVQEAHGTDYVMPTWLPFIPYILLLIYFAALPLLLIGPTSSPELLTAAPMLYSAYLALLVIAGAVAIYVLYRWISRRNRHFERTHRLYSAVLQLLEDLGNYPELREAAAILAEMREDEKRRNPVVWIILSLTPAVFYVYHFLTRDFHNHERREATILERISRILERRGIPPIRFNRVVPRRNTALYIVLSIVTLGFFALYWIYVITKDPNRHFMEHRRVEKALLSALEQLGAGKA